MEIIAICPAKGCPSIIQRADHKALTVLQLPMKRWLWLETAMAGDAFNDFWVTFDSCIFRCGTFLVVGLRHGEGSNFRKDLVLHGGGRADDGSEQRLNEDYAGAMRILGNK